MRKALIELDDFFIKKLELESNIKSKSIDEILLETIKNYNFDNLTLIQYKEWLQNHVADCKKELDQIFG